MNTTKEIMSDTLKETSKDLAISKDFSNTKSLIEQAPKPSIFEEQAEKEKAKAKKAQGKGEKMKKLDSPEEVIWVQPESLYEDTSRLIPAENLRETERDDRPNVGAIYNYNFGFTTGSKGMTLTATDPVYPQTSTNPYSYGPKLTMNNVQNNLMNKLSKNELYGGESEFWNDSQSVDLTEQEDSEIVEHYSKRGTAKERALDKKPTIQISKPDGPTVNRNHEIMGFQETGRLGSLNRTGSIHDMEVYQRGNSKAPNFKFIETKDLESKLNFLSNIYTELIETTKVKEVLKSVSQVMTLAELKKLEEEQSERSYSAFADETGDVEDMIIRVETEENGSRKVVNQH